MINKEQVEKLLKAHGLSATAKDEEIRSVLLSAQYKEDEIDSAVMVLRRNIHTNATRVDGLHKVFRSDDTLNSQEISALLGVDVNLEHHVKAGANARKLDGVAGFLVVVFSIFIAVTLLLVYMHAMQFGIFHPSSNIALKMF